MSPYLLLQESNARKKTDDAVVDSEGQKRNIYLPSFCWLKMEQKNTSKTALRSSGLRFSQKHSNLRCLPQTGKEKPHILIRLDPA